MADLTTKEKGSGVGVMLLAMGGMAAMLFLFSWLAHQAQPEPKHAAPAKPPAHGGKGGHAPAPPPAAPKDAPKELASPDSAPFWLCFFPTLGLAFLPPMAALAVGLIVGFLYGLEATCCASYDLTNPLHWLALIVDLTWSLPNTLFGFVIGNPIYLIAAGLPDRGQSRANTWISFKGSFGNVLQTLGTVNLGGAGKHEPVHLLQARILGPAYLPLQLGSYVVNSVIQLVCMLLFGWWAKLAKIRDSAWFRPDAKSAVRTKTGSSGAGDFFGWIYRYTLMELWAYATEP